jgi:hypothetical protein
MNENINERVRIMKKTICKLEFIETFQKTGCFNDKFSEDGLSMIFDYLEECDEANHTETELNVGEIYQGFYEMTSGQYLKDLAFYEVIASDDELDIYICRDA